MVKFIIEVSEDFIKEKADPMNLKKDADGKSALNKILNMIALSAIEQKIDKGEKEFTLKQENFSDNENKLFTSVLSEISLLTIGSRKEKSDEK